MIYDDIFTVYIYIYILSKIIPGWSSKPTTQVYESRRRIPEVFDTLLSFGLITEGREEDDGWITYKWSIFHVAMLDYQRV